MLDCIQGLSVILKARGFTFDLNKHHIFVNEKSGLKQFMGIFYATQKA